MLRKTYQIMQKTRGMVTDAGEHVLRMGIPGSSFKRGMIGNALSFTTCPADIWPGDPTRGADLTRFALQSQNDFLRRLFSVDGSHDLDPTFHSFSWMLDLQANGSDESKRAAAKLTNLWINGNETLMGEAAHLPTLYHRIRRIIGGYAFFEGTLSEPERLNITAGTLNHLHPLKRALQMGASPLDILYAASAMLTIGLSTGMPAHDLTTTLKHIERTVHTLVLVDGGPVTRRPSDLPELLRILVDLRHSFSVMQTPLPPFIHHAIDRMVPGIHALRLGNGQMATFHGGTVGTPATIDQILTHAGGAYGTPLTLPYTGFERLESHGQTIIIDAGRAALTNGHHASTTAFEWSCGPHAVVINCGKHGTDPLWQDLLAATSAHSTVTMDHQDNVPPGMLADVDIFREDRNGATMVEVIHNGYQTRNGFIHRRKLNLTPDGTVFSGVDRLQTAIPPLAPVNYTVRFHLHPSVAAVLMHAGPKEPTTITLTLPNGTAWKFEQNGDGLSLEDSVYLAETGKPVKTRQIVINGTIAAATKSIEWKFTQL